MTRARSVLLDRRLAPYVFLAPFLLVFIVFRVWPSVHAVIMSLQQWEGTDMTGWVGISQYATVIKDPRLGNAF